MSKISAQLKDGGRVVEVDYDFGENLEDAVSRFGAEVVFTKFRSAAIIDCQSLIRRAIKLPADKAKTDAEIQALVASWKPALAVLGAGSKKPTADTLLEKAKAMSQDERLALMQKLQAELGLA